MQLGDLNKPSYNDPEMVNKHGKVVRVPQDKVTDFLKLGLKLVDPTWKPNQFQSKPGAPRDPTAPTSRYRLEEELSEVEDALEVVRI